MFVLSCSDKDDLVSLQAAGVVSSLCRMVDDSGDNISTQLQNFWIIEEPSSYKSTYTADELACESFFIATTERDTNSRYHVRLHFKHMTPPIFKNYYELAHKRNLT